MNKPARPSRFKVIRGGRDRHWQFGSLQVWIAVAHEPPFFPDFELIEEDTWRVLGAGRQFREVTDHPIRLMTGVIEQAELEAGSCFRRGRRIFLVIHQIEQEPACRPEWIESALECAFRCVERQQGTSLSLPPPGMEHGNYSLHRSLEVLTGALRSAECTHLQRVWLQLARPQIDTAAELLDQLAASGAAATPP